MSPTLAYTNYNATQAHLLQFAVHSASRWWLPAREVLDLAPPLIPEIREGTRAGVRPFLTDSGSRLPQGRDGSVSRPGSWSIVFISSAPARIMASALPDKRPIIRPALTPCAPNTTTGYFLYLPADEVIELPISADEAAKLIMSAGLIQPQGHAALAAMAEAAKLAKPTLETQASGGRPSEDELATPCVICRYRRPSLDAVRGLKLCYEAAGVNLALHSTFGGPLSPGAA